MEDPRVIDSINLERTVWYLVAVAVPLTSNAIAPLPPVGDLILQENGDFILQENGDFILQEVA
jgi:hypothetical protein